MDELECDGLDNPFNNTYLIDALSAFDKYGETIEYKLTLGGFYNEFDEFDTTLQIATL